MNIKFDNTASESIENISEDTSNKRRWDRWVYIGIIVFLLFSFLRWLIAPWVFYSAQGNLLQQQYDVQFAYDLQILEYKVQEDQNIVQGDTLFLYQRFGSGENISTFTQDSIKLALKQDGETTNLIALQGQIEKRKLFSKALQKRLEFWKEEKVQKEKLVYLNVINPNELATIDRTIDDITYQITTTNTEYQVLLNQKAQLEEQLNFNRTLGYQGVGITHQTAAFVSPVAGRIDRLRIPTKQICYKQEKVTSIIHPDYFVRAYIDMSDLSYFKLEDEVVVVLPYDHKNLAGKVNKIYAVSELKDEVVYDNTINKNKYGVVIEVVPTNTEGWDKLTVSNIPVKVRKGRINI